MFRAGLDQREAKLFRAMSIEVIHFLRRMGVALPDVGPPGSSPKPGAGGPPDGSTIASAGAPGTTTDGGG
jgi:hypothetical protein